MSRAEAAAGEQPSARTVPRRLWAAAAFALVTAALFVGAYFRLFFGYGLFDDEGYILIGLRAFRDGGALYDDVYSQYGPMFLELLTGLFGILGLDLIPENGRFVTLSLFVGTCCLCGVAVTRLTQSLLLGICVELLTFKALFDLRSESLSAGDVTTVLLASLVGFAAIAPRRPTLGLAGIGAFAAAVALVKINVGAFALISCAFAVIVAVPALEHRRWLRLAAAAVFIATPFLVTGRQLGEPEVRSFALVAGLAALAVALVCVRCPARSARTPPESSWPVALGAGAIVLTLFSLGIALGRGSSPADLIEGIVLDPLRHPDVLSLYVALPGWALVWSAVALAVAVVVRTGWRRGDVPGGALTTGLARVAVGLVLWALVADLVPVETLTPSLALAVALPLAWVAAVPVTGEEVSPGGRFVRVLLPALAVLQGLHAYPIAAHQLSWSLFLFVPAGAVCLADGISEIRTHPLVAADLRRTRVPAALAATAMLTAVVVGGFALPVRRATNLYRSSESLMLPGTERIRVPTVQAVAYRRLTQRIREQCPSFITYPGLASLHIFTGRPAPTGQNVTSWMYLFDEKRQRRVVEDVRDIRGLCVIRFQLGIDFWRSNRPLPQRALVRYIDRNFTSASNADGFEILVRRER